MDIIFIIKLVTVFGIFNVWMLRYNKSTKYRGGKAKNLKEEFRTYGLNKWTMYIIGSIKIGISILFIVSSLMNDSLILKDSIDFYGAATMSLIMIGAIIMHIKVNDPFKKSMPAITMLTMYSIIFMSYLL